MSSVLFWFRADLRLHDQPALQAACAAGTRHLVPVFCLPDFEEVSPWGFARWGTQRRAWLAGALRDLGDQLDGLNCPLLVCPGPASLVLPMLARAVGTDTVVCEDIAAPEERAEVAALRATGLSVRTVWQSSLLDPAQLPWAENALPATFTLFRQGVERAHLSPPAPLPPPSGLPSWPPGVGLPPQLRSDPSWCLAEPPPADARSSLPHGQAGLGGGETAGLAHAARYLACRRPDSYKQTRNGLTGVDYSSKWSPWLATGALSARRILAGLRQYEAVHGATESSYWLWFELLWRDYFRFLHLQHGARLYHARGLGSNPSPPHNAAGFARWCQAATGEPLVDAAMRELAVTGYLSNRLRQVVASYLLHELGGDWRAGAAWFEACLVDYDVYSNQGNWLYVAGRGTDPRGGRRFNVARQAAEHDPEGGYRRLWGVA
ncbi:DASH family cryptochrome [Zoogloea dura]|jgi:deoxyribodipyrimidine photo-lyase|uniref:Cryptochrome DASH n=1 Tax=Zoogloea dura TaxID=2728840 RepID=A0A848G7W1_9RHOO|nr:DASH family cryptochrome [Zoogloea dura]NML27005.1 DASH family cryptochrome [Zoogloea dura]